MDEKEFCPDVPKEKGEGKSKDRKALFLETLEAYKVTILHRTVTTFGLDRLIRDQDGGDVDTIKGVRETGRFKSVHNANDFVNRGKYVDSEYHECNEIYRQFKQDAKKQVELDDAYVPGQKIYYGKASFLKKNPEKRASLDHIISAKEIHDDPGRVLARMNGADIANQQFNFAFTNAKLNSSMGQKSVEEYILWREETDNPLSADVKQRMRERDHAARKEYDRQINHAYYTSPNFYRDAEATALKLGVRMGLREAIGFVFVEVWFACEDEIKTLPDGAKLVDCFTAVKRGIQNGFENARSKYKEVFVQFGEGFIAGFLSSLMTTLINIFVTTKKATVRYIRQILMTVIRTGSILFVNRNDLKLGDQCQAAMRELIVGNTALFGIFVGNQISKTPFGSVPYIGAITQDFCSALVSDLLSCTVLIVLDRNEALQERFRRLNSRRSVDRFLRDMLKPVGQVAMQLLKLHPVPLTGCAIKKVFSWFVRPKTA